MFVMPCNRALLGFNIRIKRIQSTKQTDSTKNTMKKILTSTALLFLALALQSDACTRLVYHGEGGRTLTARSMDWKDDMRSNLWILPRGSERNGEAGPNSIEWTSTYGSVIATAYDFASADGLNEAGLMANMLWLVESEYPEMDESKPWLASSLWAQYLLDQFATVAEAVAHLEEVPFVLVTDRMPGTQRMATVHLSISDKTGDSAIIEYIDGRQVITHGRQYQVLTNSPTFEQQLALSEYWKSIGGTTMLPGTNRAADRFARATFYVNAIPQVEDRRKATAGVFSVIRNCSVPFGINTEHEPNISSTRWRVVADHKDLRYYFESAVSPNVFWVDLKKVDFTADAGVRKLDLGKDSGRLIAGEASGLFEVAKPFKFQSLNL